MNEPDPDAGVPIECDPRKAAEAAELVKRDFGALLEVLERQLGSLPADDVEHRKRINDAKATAERGIKLSNELVRMLRDRA